MCVYSVGQPGFADFEISGLVLHVSLAIQDYVLNALRCKQSECMTALRCASPMSVKASF